MEIRPPKTCGFYTETQVEIAKRAAQILSDDLRQHIPVRQIAERFSVSETSLKNYFRGVYGQNISTWLREIRMNEAARLLSDTKRPIAEISEQVGYSNQGKFAAVFKKQFGLSPLEYRRSKNLEKKTIRTNLPYRAFRIVSKIFKIPAFLMPCCSSCGNQLLKNYFRLACAFSVFINPTQRMGSRAFSSSVTPAASIINGIVRTVVIRLTEIILIQGQYRPSYQGFKF